MKGLLRSPYYRELRQALLEARQSAGLSQTEVAQALGRSQSFVAKYEGGERRLDVVEYIQLCKVLGAAPGTLLDGILEGARSE